MSQIRWISQINWWSILILININGIIREQTCKVYNVHNLTGSALQIISVDEAEENYKKGEKAINRDNKLSEQCRVEV